MRIKFVSSSLRAQYGNPVLSACRALWIATSATPPRNDKFLKRPIKALLISTILFSASAFAADDSHMDEHGGQIFHRFLLEADVGNSREGTLSSWDFNGWIGKDIDKIYLKSEGEMVDGKTNTAEFWGLYSRNVADFWDAQIGFRQDTQPESTSYAVLGLSGLAPYFFETEAHIFISDRGDVSVRIRQENDFLITQQFILQPYAEINLYTQDVDIQEVGAGISNAEIGLQTRYEITRKFSPYLDLRYERKFGETANIAKDNGENIDDFIASIGVRLMF
ncbi:MAG: copper resistance protein B [Rickettsiales bacterium]